MMTRISRLFLLLSLACGLIPEIVLGGDVKDPGVQLAKNPPMRVVGRLPPTPVFDADDFECRDEFILISK